MSKEEVVSAGNFLEGKDVSEIVFYIGAVINVINFVAPLRGVLESLRAKKIIGIAYIYFFSGICNFVGWSVYGLRTNNNFVLANNLILLGLFLVYIQLFFKINKEKSSFMMHVVGFSVVIVVLYVFPVNIVYAVAWCFNMFYTATPLFGTRAILMTKNGKNVNSDIFIVHFANCLAGTIYCVLVNDYIAMMPNLLGVITWGSIVLCWLWANDIMFGNDSDFILLLSTWLEVPDNQQDENLLLKKTNLTGTPKRRTDDFS